MALNKEDKQDVKKHYGKAIANKVAKVTRDGNSSRGIDVASQKRSMEKVSPRLKKVFARMDRENTGSKLTKEYPKTSASRDYTPDGKYINRSGYSRGLDF